MKPPRRPSRQALPFNPGRLIVDLDTISAARFSAAAVKEGKSPAVLAALVLKDWAERHAPALTLGQTAAVVADDAPSEGGGWFADRCVQQAAAAMAPVLANRKFRPGLG